MRVLVPLVLLAAVAPGCATHWAMRAPPNAMQSGFVTDPKQVSRIEKAMTDSDIAMLLDGDVKAKLPTSLAIAAVQGCESRCWLQAIGAEELTQWETVIENQPQILGVHPVSGLSVGDQSATLHQLRTAAARMGCELLLVCHRSDSSVDNYNEAAVLYWTFVGLWLVPGNTYEHRTVMQAILLDTRTGAILGTATGDKHLKGICPAAYGQVQSQKLRCEAPKAALTDLQKACKPLVKRVVAAAELAARRM